MTQSEFGISMMVGIGIRCLFLCPECRWQSRKMNLFLPCHSVFVLRKGGSNWNWNDSHADELSVD